MRSLVWSSHRIKWAPQTVRPATWTVQHATFASCRSTLRTPVIYTGQATRQRLRVYPSMSTSNACTLALNLLQCTGLWCWPLPSRNWPQQWCSRLFSKCLDAWVKLKYDVITSIGFPYWHDGSLYGMNAGESFTAKIHWKGSPTNSCFVRFLHGKCSDLPPWMLAGALCESSIASKADSFQWSRPLEGRRVESPVERGTTGDTLPNSLGEHRLAWTIRPQWQ